MVKAGRAMRKPASHSTVPTKSPRNAAIYSFVVSLILAWGLDKTIGIRVPERVEIEGLDIGVHGENGWDIGTLPEPAVSMLG